MYGTVALILGGAAVFAAVGVYELFSKSNAWFKALQFSTVAGWFGSIIGGLLTGKSARTGKGTNISSKLEWVARVCGFLFAAGALIIVAGTVYYVLANIFSDPHRNYWENLNTITELSVHHWAFWTIPPALLCLSLLFSERFDLNTFGLNQFYRNRLVRCYLGATRWQPGKRHPHRFTEFDNGDDIELNRST